MAKRFLTHLDMSGNQILNAVLTTSGFERLSSDPTTGNFEGRVYYNTASDLLKVYNGTAWISVGAITNIQGTTNEVTVSITDGVATISLPETISANLSGNASTATALATARTISLGGDLSGSATFDGSANVTITATIGANSVALGTDTSGDYVQSISSGTGVTVTGGTGEGSTPSIAIGQSVATTASPTFAGVTGGNVQVGITGDNEIDTASGNLTIDSTGGTVTVDDDLVVTGNLTVSGTTTSITTETILLADNTITLNSNATGSPTENAGIEVERGDSTNVSLRWNETNDTWEATRDGSAYAALVLAGDDIATSDITNFREEVQDAIGEVLGDSNSIDLNYIDNPTSFIDKEPVVTPAAASGPSSPIAINAVYDQGLNRITYSFQSATEPTAIRIANQAGFSLFQNLTSPGYTLTSEGNLRIIQVNLNVVAPGQSPFGLYFVAVGAGQELHRSIVLLLNKNFVAELRVKPSNSYLSIDNDGVSVDISSVKTELIIDGFTKKVAANVGNGTATSYAVQHNLGSRDVQVQVFDNSSYDTIECDVVRTDTNTVTVSFTTAPSSNAFRVVVVG